MNSTTDIHRSRADMSEELTEVAGGLRATRALLVVPLVLLAFPPLLTLIVVAALSTLVVAALVAVPIAVVAVWTMLIRRVQAHRSAVVLDGVSSRPPSSGGSPSVRSQSVRGW